MSDLTDVYENQLTVDELDEIKELVEDGLQDEAIDKLTELAKKLNPLSSEVVYEQVGVLTRDLHTAIKSFVQDERMQVIAKVDMPRASERLSSIIQMTDSAASKTLDAVDTCEPLVKQLQHAVDKLLPAWNALMKGRIDRDNFVALCKNVDGLIHDTKNNAEAVCLQLNSILLAQDYQDLTGQMIQKVISLVAEVEEKLLKFLTTFSEEERKNILDKDESRTGLAPQGPALESSKQTENVASSQDEVDDLLASLGF